MQELILVLYTTYSLATDNGMADDDVEDWPAYEDFNYDDFGIDFGSFDKDYKVCRLYHIQSFYQRLQPGYARLNW